MYTDVKEETTQRLGVHSCRKTSPVQDITLTERTTYTLFVSPFQKNKCNTESQALQKLNKLMLNKDPFQKSVSSTDQDTESTRS